MNELTAAWQAWSQTMNTPATPEQTDADSIDEAVAVNKARRLGKNVNEVRWTNLLRRVGEQTATDIKSVAITKSLALHTRMGISADQAVTITKSLICDTQPRRQARSYTAAEARTKAIVARRPTVR